MYSKNIFLVLILLFAGCKGKSQQTATQQTTSVSTAAVSWYTSIDQALADAKAQNKMLCKLWVA